MTSGIERLKKRLGEVQSFDPQSVTDQYNAPALDALEAAVDEALVRTFGAETLDYERYKYAKDFDRGPYNYAFQVPPHQFQASIARSKDSSIALLGQAIRSLEEQLEEHASRPPESQEAAPPATSPSRKVFVVHGHDEGAREAMARFLEKIELEAIILHEQPDQGFTIIEKFETYAKQVGFAVVLLTPDDLGGPALAPALVARARQNVIFELLFRRQTGQRPSVLTPQGSGRNPLGPLWRDLHGYGCGGRLETQAGEGVEGRRNSFQPGKGPGRMNQLAPVIVSHAPALIAASGPRTSYRFLEFFTAQIRNPHTRRAYARAATEFFDWLEAKGVVQITAIESVHVATYIEQLQRARSAPTAKLRLAALRHLFDWMVIRQIMPTNPAAAVRGPRHIVRRGKTPVLDPAEARQLLDAIDTTTVIGLRDRALISRSRASARRSACASRTCTRRTAGYACACTRRAASSTPCRAITISKPICTRISTARASRAIRRRCCFRPTAVLSAGSPAIPFPRQTPMR